MHNLSAGDWRTLVRSDIPTNLSNQVAHLSRRLTVGGLGVSFSVFDRAAMAVAEYAFSGPSIVFAPPDPYAPTCVYMELAAHIAAMSASEGNKTDLVVAVVSSNQTLRTFHRRVQLGRLPKIECIVPTEVVAQGYLSRYGSSDVAGATVFVDDVDDLAYVGPIDFAVVDAPIAGMGRVPEYAKYTAFVVRDPSDYGLAQLAASLPTFGWTPSGVAAVAVGERWLNSGPYDAPARGRLDNVARGVDVRLVPVVAPAVASAAAEVWRALPEIIRASSSGLAGDLVRLAFVRFQQLTHFLAPMAQFALRYGSSEAIVAGIRSAAARLPGDTGDLYLPFIGLALGDLLTALNPQPPKGLAAEALLRSLTAEVGLTQVRVAVPNIPSVAIVDEWLTSRGIATEVVPFSALRRLDPTVHLVLTGLPPAWARHVLSSGVARVIHVLAYADSEQNGSTEAELVARTIETVRVRREWFGRNEAREICWGALTAEPIDVVDSAPHPPIVGPVEIDIPEERVVASLWSGLLDIHLADRGSGSTGDGRPSDTNAKALVFTFSDARWLLLAEDSWVTRQRNGKLEEGIGVAALAVGDLIMLIDRDPRKALVDKVIEQLGASPEYAAVSEFVRVWRDALRAGYQRFGTYTALNAQFARAGISVADQTVGTWVRGITIGPMDREHVRLVGVALGNEILARKHSMICDAITALRGIHVKVGVRIGGATTVHGAIGALGTRSEDELVDERSGLTVGDFKRCVEFLKIARIEPFGTVPIQILGTLREPQDRFRGDS